MKKQIAVLPGDGVGPEVIEQAIVVLEKISSVFGHSFEYKNGLIGAVAIEKTGDPLPKKTIQLCKSADAVLFGAVGDPKYDNNPNALIRPEQGILGLRKSLALYANIRPIFTFPPLWDKSPLKKERVKNVDIVFVRELTGGIYFGTPRKRIHNGKTAIDTCVYSIKEIKRVAEIAISLAQNRHKKITVVDKANVLETSRLWRETFQTLEKKYTNISFNYMYVDNTAMQIIKNPSSFDVIVTSNLFGDILTDEASVITGSIGMLPSASIGQYTSVYEPIHGSYPKAKGTNTANPIAAILSAALLLEYSFDMKKEAQAIRNAVKKTLSDHIGTKDIFPKKPYTTSQVGETIANKIK